MAWSDDAVLVFIGEVELNTLTKELIWVEGNKALRARAGFAREVGVNGVGNREERHLALGLQATGREPVNGDAPPASHGGPVP